MLKETDVARHLPMLDLRLEYEYMKADIDAAISRCLDHQKWILGPEVKELEQNVAGYLGARHCIGCSSGTDALVLALRAIAIKTKGTEFFDRSDEVITTPFTFTATGDAILRAGATPVFVDIDPSTFNISTEGIKKYVSGHKSKVAGIIPVHLYGQACDMREMVSLARENGLFIVEDVAQAFGADWMGHKLGTIGDAGCYSFFPSKNLGGFGDAGMMATNDGETAELARMLLKHGGKDKYNVDHVGYNARIDTLHAAVLLAKLKYIDEFNTRRKKVAAIYREELEGLDGIELPAETEGCNHVFHQYTIRIKGGIRDLLQAHLSGNQISTMVYYPVPLHEMLVFKNGGAVKGGDLSSSEKAVTEVLSLPIEPLMEREDVFYVCAKIKEFFRQR